MKRYWVLPSLLGIALVFTAWWGYSQFNQRRALETNLSNQYQRAFYETVDHVQKVQNLLGKSQVAATPKTQAAVFSDLWHQSVAAQENLSQLPMYNPSIIKTSKFLNQVGDYSFALNKLSASGKPPAQRDMTQLNQLYTRSVALHNELENVQMKVLSGNISLFKLQQETAKLQGKRTTTVGAETKRLGLTEKELGNYPTLIYDGPFSDRIKTKSPQGLTGGNITAAQSQAAARTFVDKQNNETFKAVSNGLKKGPIPVYSLRLTPAGVKGARDIMVDVSKKGGHVTFYLNTRNVGKATISMEEAKKKGLSYLKSRGYDNMESTFMLKQNNIGVITMVYKQDNTLVYPDLVKVQVALDNGQVVGFDGTGYLVSHHNRTIEKPKVTVEEAQRTVASQVKVERKQEAIIPLESGKELLTWEFKATFNGETYFIYVNASNGNEERILKVLKTANGTLAM
ncbi:MAG TPA: germination protein YpeB [Bacillota bacterium]|nr:germination protein YpeB [Bacillota bacterium]